MKSLALTLAVLFCTLSFVQAADQKAPTTEEEIVAVEEINPAEPTAENSEAK